MNLRTKKRAVQTNRPSRITIDVTRLRLRTRTARYRLMPSREVLLILLNSDSGGSAEIDSDQRRDIRDRVARSRDELTIGQHSVEPFESLERRGLADFAVFLALRDSALKKIAGVAERARRHRQYFELHPPLPHLDHRLVLRIDAHQ